ncbi:hypothetical protein [Caulobacter hibisci]|uniref:Uncharacterized protein n=1 Tax=Caulobacter hibisci TaxID=2035993 RepID=A0ABS0T3K1_9CAUL|nr:hypothetical protein [Caulobacter hibisci]MBI1686470.1 hypothetical protein [Caulobacter hibisci]
MFTILPTQLGAGAMFVVCGVALWIGGRLERGLAVATILAWVGSAFVEIQDHSITQWGIFAVDVVYLGVLAGLAVFDRRVWLLFMAAFQLLIVLTHIAFAMDRSLKQWGFFSAYYLWSYAELVAFAIGLAALAWRRRVRREG